MINRHLEVCYVFVLFNLVNYAWPAEEVGLYI